jgi:outer membrane protein OmpA-like peptidoglycan-associated protein
VTEMDNDVEPGDNGDEPGAGDIETGVDDVDDAPIEEETALHEAANHRGHGHRAWRWIIALLLLAIVGGIGTTLALRPDLVKRLNVDLPGKQATTQPSRTPATKPPAKAPAAVPGKVANWTLNATRGRLIVIAVAPSKTDHKKLIDAVTKAVQEQGDAKTYQVLDRITEKKGVKLPDTEKVAKLAAAIVPFGGVIARWVEDTNTLSLMGAVPTAPDKRSVENAALPLVSADVNFLSRVGVPHKNTLACGQLQGRLIGLQRRFVFDSGSSQISRKVSAAVKKVAEVIKACPGAYVEVAGLGDKERGESRAKSVLAALINAGVPAPSIHLAEYTNGKPTTERDATKAKALQVEFRVF